MSFKVRTFKTIRSIPFELFTQLYCLCFDADSGYMREMLEGKTTQATYVTVLLNKSEVIGWALVDKRKAHCWTAEPYRGFGFAPQILGQLLAVVPQQRTVMMRSKTHQSLLEIGRYLYLNNLL